MRAVPAVSAGLVLLAAGCAEPQLVVEPGTMGTNVTAGSVLLRNVHLEAPPEHAYRPGAGGTVRFAVFNAANRGETLRSVRSPLAGRAELWWDRDCDGTPRPVDHLPLRPEGSVPGYERTAGPAYRLELTGLTRRVPAGTTVPLTFVFRRAGPVPVEALVAVEGDGSVPPPAPCPRLGPASR